MKHLIIGAGATLGEALELGNPPESCPPVMRDFARKTWSNYTPHPLLETYLRALGCGELGHDPRVRFYELEATGVTNIEQFMEFAWEHRHDKIAGGGDFPPGYISGLWITEPGSSETGVTSGGGEGFWENLLWHGVGSPLQLMMLECFYENGKGWKELRQSKLVGGRLEAGDLVLNLNYDTVFELALVQLGRPFKYSPNPVGIDELLVCKPHGSLNLVSNDTTFAFGQPEWLGMPQPPGYRSYSGLIPPRLNKRYEQHPIAQKILAPVQRRKPQLVIMWGVGLTESDIELVELYSRWSESADVLDIINPSCDVAAKAGALFHREVSHFKDLSDWEQARFGAI